MGLHIKRNPIYGSLLFKTESPWGAGNKEPPQVREVDSLLSELLGEAALGGRCAENVGLEMGKSHMQVAGGSAQTVK